MEFQDFDLDPRLQRNLQAQGFETPTPIQEAAIPAALEGRDILGSAETGTGKTAAFLLPILQNLSLSNSSQHRVRALVVLPTRELALQVAEHAKWLSRDMPVRIATIYGGVGSKGQEVALRRGVDIVIATPGRLLDHAGRRNVSFSELQVLVLDEADRMLDIGFMPDIRRIVRLLPTQRQTMLFSATLQPIVGLAKEVTRNPVRVEVETTVTPDAISQVVYQVPEHLKFELLRLLLDDASLNRVLVFARTKHRADRIVRKLQRARVSAGVIHGNRSQNQRVAALEAFRHGNTRVLVATDIAARGIDVAEISHVVNYDMPMQPEDYVHRIGRTGRAEAVGNAYSLATPTDIGMLHRIERLLEEKIEKRQLEGLDYSQQAAKRPDEAAIRRYREANRNQQPKNGRPKNGRRQNGQRQNSRRQPAK